MRKKPYTLEELFYETQEKIERDGNWPDCLDYALAVNKKKEILAYDFRVFSEICYGGNEGIYLKIYLDGSIDGTEEGIGSHRIGVIKALDRSRDTMRILAQLGADFVVDMTSIINENREDFIWTGFTMVMYDAGGRKYPCANWYARRELAEQECEKYAAGCDRITLCDMRTKKIIYDSEKDKKST